MNQPWSFLALDFLPNLLVVNGQSTFVESLVVLLHLSSFNKSAVLNTKINLNEVKEARKKIPSLKHG